MAAKVGHERRQTTNCRAQKNKEEARGTGLLIDGNASTKRQKTKL